MVGPLTRTSNSKVAVVGVPRIRCAEDRFFVHAFTAAIVGLDFRVGRTGIPHDLGIHRTLFECSIVTTGCSGSFLGGMFA